MKLILFGILSFLRSNLQSREIREDSFENTSFALTRRDLIENESLDKFSALVSK